MKLYQVKLVINSIEEPWNTDMMMMRQTSRAVWNDAFEALAKALEKTCPDDEDNACATAPIRA